MDFKSFKSFLKLFQYGIDDSKKKESIAYIIEKMKEAERTHKVQTFDKLADAEYSPNLCLDRNGNLYFNTKTLSELFDAYQQGIKYVNTEIAQLEREKFIAMHEIALKPFSTMKMDTD